MKQTVPTKASNTPASRPAESDPRESANPELQGEGNYEAARRHRKSLKRFLDEGGREHWTVARSSLKKNPAWPLGFLFPGHAAAVVCTRSLPDRAATGHATWDEVAPLRLVVRSC
jgi:hypothetical protein